VPARTLNAGPNPRYFGPGRGVTYLNFLSDQFTGFHAAVVPGALRDSLYILEGLLEQQTSLHPVELMSDTAGYSDIVFGLFRLLGYQFSPRLADLGDTRFWRSRSARSPSLIIPELPKTRSGKIMRRLLGDVADRRNLGDVTTLADPTVMNLIGERMKAPGRRGRRLTAGSADQQSGPGGSMVERHQGTSSGAARPVGAAARSGPSATPCTQSLTAEPGRPARPGQHRGATATPARPGTRAQAHCHAGTVASSRPLCLFPCDITNMRRYNQFAAAHRYSPFTVG